MTTQHPIKKAVEAVGNIATLARHLHVTPPTVHQWISGVRPIPAERCPQIERATGGAVRCEDLRPDVDWAVLRSSAVETAARDSGVIGTLGEGEAA